MVARGVVGFDAELSDERLIVVEFSGPPVLRDIAAVNRKCRSAMLPNLTKHLSAFGHVPLEGNVGVGEVDELERIFDRRRMRQKAWGDDTSGGPRYEVSSAD